MFLDFANFYIKFIKNFCRIARLLTLIFQTIGNNKLSHQAYKNKISCDIPSIGNSTSGGGVGRTIENLSTFANLSHIKKSNLTKSKKLILAKKSDLLKANSTKINGFSYF